MAINVEEDTTTQMAEVTNKKEARWIKGNL